MIKQNGKHQVKRLYIHHTAGFLQPGQTLEAYAKWMQQFHASKWPNECKQYAGPHFLIGKDGKVINTRPIELTGIHVEGNNTGTIGAELIGYYHPPHNENPPQAQIEALCRLYAILCLQGGLNPQNAILGHRDSDATSCPGDRLYNKLTYIKGRVKQIMSEPLPDIKGHWAEAVIRDLAAKGIMTGSTDGLFYPNKSLTRAEAAALVSKLLNYLGQG